MYHHRLLLIFFLLFIGRDTILAQTNGIESNGDEVAYTWDTKWKSAVHSYDDRWTTEISVPFRSLRYFDGSAIWGINFGRFDLKTNEKSAWAPMPR